MTTSTPADDGIAAARRDDVTRTEAAEMLQTFSIATLGAAARGEIDLNKMAKQELAYRGLSEYGTWIGFDRAEERMKGSMITRSDGQRVWVVVPDKEDE